MSAASSRKLLITDLPDDALEKIMHNLSYDEIAKNRIVCQRFNSVGKGILNRESQLWLNQIEKYKHDVKATLPRRESARNAHPRYRHFEVLNMMHSQMNWLAGMYKSYIEKDLCCFIPGKVIDEAIRLMKFLKRTNKLMGYTSDICKDLREFSDMAGEHFDEVIKPSLQNIAADINARKWTDLTTNLVNSIPKVITQPSPINDSIKKIPGQSFKKIYHRINRNKIGVLCVKGQLGKIRSRLLKQNEKLNELLEQKEELKEIRKQNEELKEIHKQTQKRLESIEQKLNIPRVESKKQNSLEICEKIFSHIKALCESNSVECPNVDNRVAEVSLNQQTNLEQKLDNITALLSDIVMRSKQ